MGYVNKKDAVRNMSNPKDFDIYKNRFLKIYKDAQTKISNLVNDKATDELYTYMTNLNNISLNIGSSFLNHETEVLLDKIKKGDYSPIDFESLYEIIDGVYQELQLL